MTPEEKALAITSAQTAVEDARKAISGAKAELQTATDANDEAAKTTAQGKITSAEAALATAEAKVTELQGDAAALADDLLGTDGKPLADGTSPKKNVQVPFDKFQDLNEKSKLLEQFGPLLAKLQKDPTLVEKLMKADDPNASIADRLAALELREANAKKQTIKDVITKAITIWPDFRNKWAEIKPLVTGMEASGIPYEDAVQRAYFAVNPDAVRNQERLVQVEQARARENNRGKGSMGGGNGGTPIVHTGGDEEYTMSEADAEFARKAGIDPGLYQKHAGWIERFADL